MKIVVLFNLRERVDVAAYEDWARTTDMPTVRGLGSVSGFDVLRCTGLLGAEGAPPYQYVELIDVDNMKLFGTEVATEAMGKVAGEFQAFADSPIFILTENL